MRLINLFAIYHINLILFKRMRYLNIYCILVSIVNIKKSSFTIKSQKQTYNFKDFTTFIIKQCYKVNKKTVYLAIKRIAKLLKCTR